jgi:hypothetical protein
VTRSSAKPPIHVAGREQDELPALRHVAERAAPLVLGSHLDDDGRVVGKRD